MDPQRFQEEVLKSDEDSSFENQNNSENNSFNQTKERSQKYTQQDFLMQTSSRINEFMKHDFDCKFTIVGLVLLLSAFFIYYFLMVTDFKSNFQETIHIQGFLKTYHSQVSNFLDCMNAATLAKMKSLAKFNQSQLGETLKKCPESMSLWLINFKKVD